MVKEICTTVTLPFFDVSIEPIAIFAVYTKQVIKKRTELFDTCLAVVDARHFCESVNKFYQVRNLSRPIEPLTRLVLWNCVGTANYSLHANCQKSELRINDGKQF